MVTGMGSWDPYLHTLRVGQQMRGKHCVVHPVQAAWSPAGTSPFKRAALRISQQ
jgi:hypothetical protein